MLELFYSEQFFAEPDARWTCVLHLSSPSVCKLQKLYVLPNLQTKGVGGLLLEEVTAQAKRWNCEILRLNVNRYNRAVGFYEKHGFEIVGEEDIDIGGGYFMNDYVMEAVVQG